MMTRLVLHVFAVCIRACVRAHVRVYECECVRVRLSTSSQGCYISSIVWSRRVMVNFKKI